MWVQDYSEIFEMINKNNFRNCFLINWQQPVKPPELNPETEESLPSRRSPEGPDPPVLTEATSSGPSDSPQDLESVQKKMDLGRYKSVVSAIPSEWWPPQFKDTVYDSFYKIFHQQPLISFRSTLKQEVLSMCWGEQGFSSVVLFVWSNFPRSWSLVTISLESFRPLSTMTVASSKVGKLTAWLNLFLFG